MFSTGEGRIACLKRIGPDADVGGVDGNTDTTAHEHGERIARVVWFCAFVLPLILAALLLGMKSAQAASLPPESDPLAFEEEFELEEEDEAEFAEEECEIAQEEAEEGELTKAEANETCKEAREVARESAGSSSAATAECPIHSASAHASTHHNRLKLTIGYTTNTPVAATLQIHGIGTFKRHLGKSGVLRFSGDSAKRHGRLVIRIKLPQGSAGCPSRRLVLSPG